MLLLFDDSQDMPGGAAVALHPPTANAGNRFYLLITVSVIIINITVVPILILETTIL